MMTVSGSGIGLGVAALLALAGCGVGGDATDGGVDDPTAREAAAGALITLHGAVMLSDSLLQFDPLLDCAASVEINANMIAAAAEGLLGGCGTVVATGPVVTADFTAPGACALGGVHLEGKGTLTLARRDAGLSVTVELGGLRVDGRPLAGTATWSTADCARFDLAAAFGATTGTATVTGSPGLLSIGATLDLATLAPPVQLHLDGVIMRPGDCYPSAGTMAISRDAWSEIITFDAATAASGIASRLVAGTPTPFQLPAYGTCPSVRPGAPDLAVAAPEPLVYVMPHFVDGDGYQTAGSLDTLIAIAYEPGWAGVAEAGGATVELYLYDDAGAPLANRGRSVCAPCSFPIGGQGTEHRRTIVLDRLIMAQGGSFDSPMKRGFAVLRVVGADPAGITISAVLANTRSGPLDVDLSPLAIRRAGEGSGLFVLPHFVEKPGSATSTPFTFDTTLYVTYFGGLAGTAGGGGAAVDLFLLDGTGSAPLLNNGQPVCNPCRVDVGGASPRKRVLALEELIAAKGGSFDASVKTGVARLQVSGTDPKGVTLSGVIVNAKTGPKDLDVSPADPVRPGGASTWVIPHFAELRGTVATTQWTNDAILYAAYAGGGGQGEGATVSLYLYGGADGRPLANNGQDVCNPCRFDVGGGAAAKRTIALEELITQRTGALDAAAKSGTAVVQIGGADPAGVALAGLLVTARSGPVDLDVAGLPLVGLGGEVRDRVLPYVVERAGTIVSTQSTFDTTIWAAYTPGLGGTPAGAGASVEVYLYDATGKAPLANQGQAVCDPCRFDLGGGVVKRTISLDDLILAKGGSFDSSMKLGAAVVRPGGADPAGVSIGGYVVNAATSPRDTNAMRLGESVGGRADVPAPPPVDMGGVAPPDMATPAGVTEVLYQPKMAEPKCAYGPIVGPSGVFCGCPAGGTGLLIKIPLAGGPAVVVAPATPSPNARSFWQARSTTRLAFQVDDQGYARNEIFAVYSLPLATVGMDPPGLLANMVGVSPLAANETHVFYRMQDQRGFYQIQRTAWQGGATDLLVGMSASIGRLAADASHVYFNRATQQPPWSIVARVPVAGGNVQDAIYVTGQGAVWSGYSIAALAVDDADLYVIPAGSGVNLRDSAVFKVSKAGGVVTELAKATGPTGLALGPTDVYFSSEKGLFRVAKTGGAAQQIAAQASSVDADATHVYWIVNNSLYRQAR